MEKTRSVLLLKEDGDLTDKIQPTTISSKRVEFYPVSGNDVDKAGYAGNDYFYAGTDGLQLLSISDGEFIQTAWDEEFQFSALASKWGDIFSVTGGYVGAVTLDGDIVLALWDAEFRLEEVIDLSAELGVDMRFNDIDVSADGKNVVYADMDGLHLYRLDTRQEEDIVSIDYENDFEGSQGIIGFSSCGFIENGKKVLFLATQNELPLDYTEEPFEIIGIYDIEEHRMEVNRVGDVLLDGMDVFDGFALLGPGTELDGTYSNVFYRYDELNGIQSFALTEEGEAYSISPSLDGELVVTSTTDESAETFRVYASDTGQLIRVGCLERETAEEALGGELLLLGTPFILEDGQSLIMTATMQDNQGNERRGLLKISFE